MKVEPLRWYHYHVLVWWGGKPVSQQGDCLAPDRQSVRDDVIPSIFVGKQWQIVSTYYMGEASDFRKAFPEESVEPRIDQLDLPI